MGTSSEPTVLDYPLWIEIPWVPTTDTYFIHGPTLLIKQVLWFRRWDGNKPIHLVKQVNPIIGQRRQSNCSLHVISNKIV